MMAQRDVAESELARLFEAVEKKRFPSFERTNGGQWREVLRFRLPASAPPSPETRTRIVGIQDPGNRYE